MAWRIGFRGGKLRRRGGGRFQVAGCRLQVAEREGGREGRFWAGLFRGGKVFRRAAENAVVFSPLRLPVVRNLKPNGNAKQPLVRDRVAGGRMPQFVESWWTTAGSMTLTEGFLESLIDKP